jgi:tetratricopeptide (TPR) repeat protein
VPTATTPTVAPPDSADAPPSPEDFDDLVAWLHVLQASVKALNEAQGEEERARYRRSLALVLAGRGLYEEAEKALVSSLASDARDRTTSVADSVALADIRLRKGDEEGASAVARSVDVGRASPTEQLRLAEILLDTGFPALAVDLAENARKNVGGEAHERATLLLAHALWEQGEPKRALARAREVTASPGADPGAYAAALVLEADCQVALGRTADATTTYERAAGLELGAEEASWVALQRGNLARRAGRTEEAIALYRETVERWPDTFYATQAEWFLRVATQLEALRKTEAARG